MELKDTITALNEGFKTFRAEHQRELATVQTQVDELYAREQLRKHAGLDQPAAGSPVQQLIRAHYARRAEQRDEPRGEMSLHDVLRGVAGMRTSDAVRAALNTGTGSAGGFSVPSVVAGNILAALSDASAVLAAGAQVELLDEQMKQQTTVAVDALPEPRWRAEAGTVEEAEPTFRAVTATPRSLACVIKVSRELLADGVGLEAALRNSIAQGFAAEIDRTALEGSGVAPEPTGLRLVSGVHALTLGTGNGLKPTSFGFLVQAAEKIWSSAGRPSAVIMHPRDMSTLAQLVADDKQPLLKPDVLADLRMLTTNRLKIDRTVGSSTDCSEAHIGDFGSMKLKVREDVNIQLLTEAFSGSGQVGFLCHARLDVVVQHPKLFATIKGVRA